MLVASPLSFSLCRKPSGTPDGGEFSPCSGSTASPESAPEDTPTGADSSLRSLKAALSMDLPHGYHSSVEETSHSHAGIEITGRLYAPDGGEAGYFRRTFRPEERIVEHNMLEMYGSDTGKGVGSAFAAQAEDAYRKMGYTTITMEAGLESGGYVWAKAGYSWGDIGAPPQVKKFARDKLGKIASNLSDDDVLQVSRLISGSRTTAKQLADWHSSDGKYSGKNILAGSGWNASKSLIESVQASAVLEFYNKNHDHKGRFTSAQGGGVHLAKAAKDTSSEVGGGVAKKDGYWLRLKDGGTAGLTNEKKTQERAAAGELTLEGTVSYRGMPYVVYSDPKISADRRSQYLLATIDHGELPPKMTFGAHELALGAPGTPAEGLYTKTLGKTTVGVKGTAAHLVTSKGQVAAALDLLETSPLESTHTLRIYVGSESKQVLGSLANKVLGAAKAFHRDAEGRAFMALPRADKALIKTVQNDQEAGFLHAASTRDPIRSVVAHEMAHIDDKGRPLGESTGAKSARRRIVPVSKYAEVSNSEAYAEAKSLWQVGTQQEYGEHAAALEGYAKEFGWTK